MTPTVFYSWQSDLPEKGNHYFIRDSLNRAVKGLEVYEPLRVESDTTNTPGTPDIMATIFERIAAAEVAVFDVTPVARITTPATSSPSFLHRLFRRSKQLYLIHDKALPNPNVLIELGFAAKAIGWERIICVMNQGHGHNPNELPFDLRARRFPICYKHHGLDKPPADTEKHLSDKLSGAIKSCVSFLHKQVEGAFAQMNHQCLTLIHTFQGQNSFAFPDGNFPPGVDRLLDLGIIWCHSEPSKATYGYHWTHLGRRVCETYSQRQNVSAT